MASDHATIADLRVEHLREPPGVGTARPRLSWTVATDVPGWRRVAYKIEVAGDVRPRAGTGRLESDQSVLVGWAFEPLLSREAVAGAGLECRPAGHALERTAGGSTPLREVTHLVADSSAAAEALAAVLG